MFYPNSIGHLGAFKKVATKRKQDKLRASCLTRQQGWLSNTVKRIRVVQMVKLASRTVRTVRFVKIFTDRE